MKPTVLLALPISLTNGPSPISQKSAETLSVQCADYWRQAAQDHLKIDSVAAPVFVSDQKVPTGSAAHLPDGTCNTAAWSFCRDALRAAYGLGIKGTMPAYFVPHIDCRGHGTASVGNGPVYMNGGTSLQMYCHELGHAYGLEHAGGLKMQGGVPFDPAHAVYNEYGDPYDPMGTGMSWLCPLHAFRLGIRPTPKRIPRENRTMLLKQTGQPNDNDAPRAVQITRGGPQGYTYQLTYQSPTNLNKPPVADRIVIVRLVGGISSYYLAGLKTGKVWNDPLGGVKFTNIGPANPSSPFCAVQMETS